MERKALPHFTKSIEDRTVTGIFAVHGNIDEGSDRSWPGSFANVAVNGRTRTRFLWQHNADNPPIAVITGMRELSRADLPASVLGYAPDASGGVEVTRTYNTSPLAEWVLTGIKDGSIDEMSYAYDVTRFDYETIDERQVRNIREVKLYDISDVNWGLNPATVGVKRLLEGGPLTAYAEQAEASLTAFVDEARRLDERRVKVGRVLSDTNRKLIADTADALEGAIVALRDLLTATDPDAGKASPTQVARIRAESLRIRAALTSIGV
jgi:HK97 family phage prohead protease